MRFALTVPGAVAGILAMLFVALGGCTSNKSLSQGPAPLQPPEKEAPEAWQPRDVKPNHLALARDLVAQKQYAVAIRQLSQAMKEHKNEPELHYLLGVCRRETGDLTGAQADFRHAIAQDSEYAPAYNGLGITAYLLKEMIPAREAFEKAVALDPANADFQNNLGVLEMQQNRPEEARDQFEQCLRLNPAHARAKNNLAACLLKLGQEEETLLFLKRQFPPAAACNNMGGLYLAAGETGKARKMFRQALVHDPNLVEARRNLNRLEKTGEENNP